MPEAPRLSFVFAAAAASGPASGPAERIRALYAALRSGNLSAVLARLAPGVEWEEDRGEPGLPIRRRHLGRGAVARLLADPCGFPCGLEPVHLARSGGEVVVLAAEGAGPDGAAPLRLEAHLWTLDADGLVTRFRQVPGPAAPAGPRH